MSIVKCLKSNETSPGNFEDWYEEPEIGSGPGGVWHNLEELEGKIVHDAGSRFNNDVKAAIPSPWALFDFVKGAFKHVAGNYGHQHKELTRMKNGADGEYGNIYDFAISDALDVGQIFFYKENFSNVKIIKWDKAKELEELRKMDDGADPHRRHQKLLGDTMDLYFKTSKARHYNAERVSNLYLIQYCKPGTENDEGGNITLGMMSPTTLFCGIADTHDIEKEILALPDLVFDGGYRPFDNCYSLSDRWNLFPDYVEWLYALSLQSDIEDAFKDFCDYVKKEVRILEKNGIVVRGNKNGYSKYTEYIKTECNCKISIIDAKDTVPQLFLMRPERERFIKSDFGININIDPDMVKYKNIFGADFRVPLVLPDEESVKSNENRYNGWILDYNTRAGFDRNRHVVKVRKSDGVMDEQEINSQNRKIYGTQMRYPYLSSDDFLEKNIICPNDQMDARWYHDDYWGGDIIWKKKVKGDNGSDIWITADSKNIEGGYLLPLKETFFNYFTVADLREREVGASGQEKKMFEMVVLTETIKKTMPSGMEIAVDIHRVEVTLRIPVMRGDGVEYIEFCRTYHSRKEDVNDNSKHYYINEFEFEFYLFPNVCFPNGVRQYYRAIIGRKTDIPANDKRFCLEFCGTDGVPFRKGDEGVSRQTMEDRYGTAKWITWKYEVDECLDPAVESKRFTHIRVKRPYRGNECSGVIIPNFRPPEGREGERTNPDKKFTFAVDFGTTNMYVGYNVSEKDTDDKWVPQEEVETLDVLPDKRQMSNLMYSNREKSSMNGKEYWKDAYNNGESVNKINYDFMPTVVDGDNYFPLRTVLCIRSPERPARFISNPVIYEDANIAYEYGRLDPPKYDSIVTNLKWGGTTIPAQNDGADGNNHAGQIQCNVQNSNNGADPIHGNVYDESLTLIRCFIDSLMVQIRNKVIIDGGILDETRVVWFYPVSMENDRVTAIEKIWNESYKKYIGSKTNANVVRMTESYAPYFSHKYGPDAITIGSTVTIDIGGETSDIVVAKPRETYEEGIEGNNDVEFISSFRFACNALFTKGLIDSAQERVNGLIEKYFKEIIGEIENVDKTLHVITFLKDLYNRKNTSEIAAFFFTLKNISKKVEDKEKLSKIDYMGKLSKDAEMRIVFIIFYSAIIYYLAQIIRAKPELKIPNRFAFSGNGSKILSVLSGDLDLTNVANKRIFSDMLGSFALKIFQKVFNDDARISGINEIRVVLEEHPKRATCQGGLWCSNKIKVEEIRTLEQRWNEGKVILKTITPMVPFEQSDKYSSVLNGNYQGSIYYDIKQFVECIFSDDMITFIEEKFYGSSMIKGFLKRIKENCLNDDLLNRLCKETITRKSEDLRKEYGNEGVNKTVSEPFFFYPIVGIIKFLADKMCYNNTNIVLGNTDPTDGMDNVNSDTIQNGRTHVGSEA